MVRFAFNQQRILLYTPAERSGSVGEPILSADLLDWERRLQAKSDSARDPGRYAGQRQKARPQYTDASGFSTKLWKGRFQRCCQIR